jgi:hypothetical protein
MLCGRWILREAHLWLPRVGLLANRSLEIQAAAEEVIWVPLRCSLINRQTGKPNGYGELQGYIGGRELST